MTWTKIVTGASVLSRPHITMASGEAAMSCIFKTSPRPTAVFVASDVVALGALRAIKARGPADRGLIVLLTDAEELNLDGARTFFSEHPLRHRVGAVVNLEARGGGGRALMFETGPGNAHLQGQAKILKAQISGSGDLIASDLMLNTANVRVTGSSEARVKVRQANGDSRNVTVTRDGAV